MNACRVVSTFRIACFAGKPQSLHFCVAHPGRQAKHRSQRIHLTLEPVPGFILLAVRIASLLQDLRFAARMLVKHRGVTVIAIITLGVGIGANVAVFSVIDAVLLQPLPYVQSDRLVKIWEKRARLPRGRVSWADYAEWKVQSRAFDGIAAYQPGDYNLTGDSDPEQLQGASVSASLFRLLRISPQLGRSFSADDEKPGAHQVVILSHGLWQRRFG